MKHTLASRERKTDIANVDFGPKNVEITKNISNQNLRDGFQTKTGNVLLIKYFKLQGDKFVKTEEYLIEHQY